MLVFDVSTSNRGLYASAVAILWILGCGPKGVAYEDYGDLLEGATCEWRTKCNLEASVPNCRESSTIDRDDPYQRAAIKAGRILYDGDAASRCLDEINQRSCARNEPPTEFCSQVFAGQVAPEELCLTSEECVGEGFCALSPNCADMCCPGDCRLLPAPSGVGESCVNPTVECAEGSYCGIDAMTNRRTVCTAKLGLGEACGDGFSECEDTAYCGPLSNQCEARIADGEICENGNGCQEGLVCTYFPESMTERRCMSAIASATLGEPCVEMFGVQPCAELGTYCSADGFCAHTGGDGDSCASTPCSAYAPCGENKICALQAGPGDSCGYQEIPNLGYVYCAGDLFCPGGSDLGQVCEEREHRSEACEIPEAPATGE